MADTVLKIAPKLKKGAKFRTVYFCNIDNEVFMNELAIEYQQNFYLWLCHNIGLLRNGRLSEIDVENIAEELDGMSESQQIDEKIADVFTDAIEYATLETGIPDADFPQTCPYFFEQALDKNFW